MNVGKDFQTHNASKSYLYRPFSGTDRKINSTKKKETEEDTGSRREGIQSTSKAKGAQEDRVIRPEGQPEHPGQMTPRMGWSPHTQVYGRETDTAGRESLGLNV